MEQEEATYFSRAKELVAELQGRLPTRVDLASTSLKSKVPMKAVALREALMYRLTELAEGACQLYEAGKFVPSIVLIRSACETAAMLFSLHKRIKDALSQDQVDDDFDAFLMRATFGAKDGQGPLEAYQILKAIDHVDRELKDFRKMYDMLSEFTHPNWSGTTGPYSKFNEEKVWIDFGRNILPIPYLTILLPLVGSLEMFIRFYSKITELMPALILKCEARVEG